MKTIIAILTLASAQFFGAFEASSDAASVLEGRQAQIEQVLNQTK